MDFGKFLGNVEIKPIDSVAITLDTPQGAGKTRFFYYIMNLFTGQGYKCLFVSLEEHPLSELAQAKKRQYITIYCRWLKIFRNSHFFIYPQSILQTSK